MWQHDPPRLAQSVACLSRTQLGYVGYFDSLDKNNGIIGCSGDSIVMIIEPRHNLHKQAKGHLFIIMKLCPNIHPSYHTYSTPFPLAIVSPHCPGQLFYLATSTNHRQQQTKEEKKKKKKERKTNRASKQHSKNHKAKNEYSNHHESLGNLP
ncbi:hypothetical protein BDZ91DRAFT_405913 [Kalaharituber pfeilii]|nr:hypothetical protein BDZ91DRAFT_405913 [Kalaharituber pfeilii]